MEISRKELMLIVKATRTSIGLGKALRSLSRDRHMTIADEIGVNLMDVLFILSGERESGVDDFCESSTYTLLTGVKSDGEVTDEIIRMAENPKQPVPKFPDREAMRKQADKGCGYMYRPRYPREETPEGEWT